MKKIGDYLTIEELSAATVSNVQENGRICGVINGKLFYNTPVKVLYMASLELDGMEMHESFRMALEPGESRFDLPEIAVFNPICSNDEKIGNYTLTLKIYASGGVVHEFSSLVRFN